MKSPKLILPVLVAMLLSIGIVSYVSAEDTTPYLQKLFNVFGVSENSNIVTISTYDSESEDFVGSMEITPEKVTLNGELCLNDECATSLSQWNEIGNSVYYSGGVGIGSFLNIQHGKTEGDGTIDLVSSDFIEFAVTSNSENPANLSPLKLGDTIIVYLGDNRKRIEGTITQQSTNTSAHITFTLNSDYLETVSTSDTLLNASWSFIPDNVLRVEGSDEENVLSVNKEGNVIVQNELRASSADISGNLRVNDIWIGNLGNGFWLSEAFRPKGDSLTYFDCLNVGMPVNSSGEILDDSTGKKFEDYAFCKVKGNVCPPGGWKGSGWSETSSVRCVQDGGGGCGEDKCDTGEHTWSLAEQESCGVYRRYISGLAGCKKPGEYHKICYATINHIGCE